MSRALRLPPLLIVLTLLAVWPCLVAAQENADVPTYRGNPAHTGVHPGPGPSKSATVRWQFAIPNNGGAYQPSVVNGVVYVGGRESLIAVDAQTGDLLWEWKPVDLVLAQSTPMPPSVAHGSAYIASLNYIFAIDVVTGSERWRFDVGRTTGMDYQPTVAEDTVYFSGGGENTGMLYAVEAATGEERWHTPLLDGVLLSPAVVDRTVFAVGFNRTWLTGALYALDAATGGPLWSYPIGAVSTHRVQWEPHPAVVNETVYTIVNRLSTGPNGMDAVDAMSGQRLWHFPADEGQVFHSPVVANESVYLVDHSGKVFAVDSETGEERWHAQIADARSSPVVADGVVYIGDGVGGLYALDMATGEERWYIAVGTRELSSPAIIGGAAYVSSSDGMLYAIMDK